MHPNFVGDQMSTVTQQTLTVRVSLLRQPRRACMAKRIRIDWRCSASDVCGKAEITGISASGTKAAQ